MKWMEQEAVPVDPATRIQVLESSEPCRPDGALKVIVPEGLVGTALVSATEAVQVDIWSTTMGDWHDTLVAVV